MDESRCGSAKDDGDASTANERYNQQQAADFKDSSNIAKVFKHSDHECPLQKPKSFRIVSISTGFWFLLNLLQYASALP